MNRFQSSFSANWRRVVALGDGESTDSVGWTSLPGGAPDDPADPSYASRLPQWLTGDYDPVLMRWDDLRNEASERFVPPRQ